MTYEICLALFALMQRRPRPTKSLFLLDFCGKTNKRRTGNTLARSVLTDLTVYLQLKPWIFICYKLQTIINVFIKFLTLFCPDKNI